MTDMTGLRTLDNLGSVRAIDAPVEAICWTHRGSSWYRADRLALMNDPQCWD